jgi:NAD(P)-dependent dehydrogenase (short-subunit alcohol dehydrogenase family)
MDKGIAVVIGANGGVGGQLVAALEGAGYAHVLGLSRTSTPALDLTNEASIAEAAAYAATLGEVRLVIVATGFLHNAQFSPEKSLKQLDPAHMALSFALNAIGPALALKHFLPLCPREGRFVFAALSARVGSIGDNHLGGWHSYRAAKSALNQYLRTAAIEIGRTRKEAIVAALHPGTVNTKLSSPFVKNGLDVREPEVAAADVLRVIAGLTPEDNGGFFDHKGERVAW